MERHDHCANPRIVIRILPGKTRGNRFHLGFGLLLSDAGFHPRDHSEEMIATLRRFLRQECNWHPELILPV